MKTRIYIDTSVVGGYFDEEFQEDTKRFYKWFEENDVVFVISDLLDIELINAPEKVRNSLGKYDNSKFERIKLSQESIVLANEYIKHKVVGISSLEDCRHIAMATVHKVDYVVSWNFKHIVNIDRIIGYNSVNLMLGYEPVEIYTPFQLLNHENQ
jgi:predicted nucleic acid-binding protein